MKVLRAQQTYCTRGLRIRELLMRLASVSLFLLFLVYFLSLLMSLVSQVRPPRLIWYYCNSASLVVFRRVCSTCSAHSISIS